MQDSSQPIKTPKGTGWDYRYGHNPSALGLRHLSHPNDQSLMSYRGHQVLQTLIRAYFSPIETTGQKYIYSGSYNGSIYGSFSYLLFFF